MSSLKIYSYPGNYRVWKSTIAAAYSGVEIEEINSEECEVKDFSITNKVPVLVTPQGSIVESNAIARYVAKLRPAAGMMGETFFDQAVVEQWLDWSTNELEAARAVWLYPVLGYMTFNGQAYAKAKKDTQSCLELLNSYLLTRTYLVGQRVTLADIVVATALVEMYKRLFAPGFVKNYPNVTRWFTTCINQPEFARVIGKVEFAKNEEQAPKPKKEEGKADKKEGKEAQQKGSKKGSKKKNSKKKNSKKKKSNKDADEAPLDEPKPEKKAPHPLSLLPKSTMLFDVVKKQLWSERPICKSWFDTFWATEGKGGEGDFDPAGYSVYRCDYQYNSDNTIDWQTENLVNGFIQRLEEGRKWAMGAVIVYEAKIENKDRFPCAGVFMFRGQEMPPEFKDCGDAGSYTWAKLDMKNDENKQEFKDIFISEKYKGGNVYYRAMFK